LIYALSSVEFFDKEKYYFKERIFFKIDAKEHNFFIHFKKEHILFIRFMKEPNFLCRTYYSYFMIFPFLS
jgi:hypothetical protein